MSGFKVVALSAFVLTSIIFSPAKVWATPEQDEAELADLRKYCIACTERARDNRLKAQHMQAAGAISSTHKDAVSIQQYQAAVDLIKDAQKLDIQAMETQWTISTIERAIKAREKIITQTQYNDFSKNFEDNEMTPQSKAIKETHISEVHGAEAEVVHAQFVIDSSK
ncbi:hypothetical protein AGMMS49936_11230 [Endomicrobiia bacterium]|nr:hypothetical protein AGMMS49936_11230 [Endomicrobiia bacterium]